MIDMSYKLHITRVGTTSKSVRTTIPEEIARELNIKPGDVLDWEIEVREGRKIARVRKLE